MLSQYIIKFAIVKILLKKYCIISFLLITISCQNKNDSIIKIKKKTINNIGIRKFKTLNNDTKFETIQKTCSTKQLLWIVNCMQNFALPDVWGTQICPHEADK